MEEEQRKGEGKWKKLWVENGRKWWKYEREKYQFLEESKK